MGMDVYGGFMKTAFGKPCWLSHDFGGSMYYLHCGNEIIAYSDDEQYMIRRWNDYG
ncbi:MAG: hypothetical protein LBN05_03445 [Oscillospiraceae bacterium]|jgi:hypothetical protein|nr:hypothetical protein [Oscillospiraceae bacterium]